MSTGGRHYGHGLNGLLIDVLPGLPRLDDAACSGRADLFEPQRDNEPRSQLIVRHARAEQMCATCPALDPCRDWAAEQQPDGSVLAGRSSVRPRRQPKDDAA